MIRSILVACIVLTGAAFGHEVRPIDAKQAEAYRLDPAFFKKGTMVQGILIATSDKVSDFAHLEAAYQFDQLMTTLEPATAGRIREGGVLCILVGHSELTSDVPQFRNDKTGEELAFYNWRSRGFLTKVNERPTVLFAEEDVLEYEGGMQIESILIHEFGHVIHRPGFDEETEKELTAAYEEAKRKGLWNDGRAAQKYRRVKGDVPVLLLDALACSFPDQPREFLRVCLDEGDILVNNQRADSGVKVTEKDEVLIMFGGPKQCYAATNRAEYFAEGVQCWFDTNRTMDHDHNHIHTRAQLKEYDPGLACLCERLLGDRPWRFVSPRERAGTGHLAGYDPAKAPVVKDPDFIENASLDYYDKYWKDYWQRLRDKHADKISERSDQDAGARG